MNYRILLIAFLLYSSLAKSQDFSDDELNAFLKIEKITGYEKINEFKKFLKIELRENSYTLELEILDKIELEDNLLIIQYFFNEDFMYKINGILIIDRKNRKIVNEKKFVIYSVGASDGGTTFWYSEIKLAYPLIIVNKTTKWKNNNDCDFLDFYVERENAEIYLITNNYTFELKYATDFVNNEYYQEKDIASLIKYDKSKLRLYRNYFFAKHGYKFKSTDLKEYFENNMRDYKPTHDNVESLLTHWDRYMINYIKLLENQK